MPESSALILRECIQKVATGPEYSKDLSFDEAFQAMSHILTSHADPVQIAIFFIALRMKRETDEENRGILQAIIDRSITANCNVEELVDVADAYDGHIRGLPSIAFLPAVLAACGMPACSHGLNQVGPKFGITSHKILSHLGINVDLSPAQAAEKISNSEIGWAYIDQKNYCPELHALVPLRETMIKRSVLTTVEVLISPLRGQNKTHLLTGYVHKAYPPIYDSLAKQAKFDSSILVRGVEGGVIPSLQQAAKIYYSSSEKELEFQTFNPNTINIKQSSRAVPLPKDLSPSSKGEIPLPFDVDYVAGIAAETGLAALKGEKGPAYDSLVYSAAITLFSLKKSDSMPQAAEQVRKMLDSGAALAHFQANQDS